MKMIKSIVANVKVIIALFMHLHIVIFRETKSEKLGRENVKNIN